MSANRAGFVRAATLLPVRQTMEFKRGDTLVSNIRPYFKKIVYCGFEGGCSTDVLCFRSHRENLSLYVYNALYRNTLGCQVLGFFATKTGTSRKPRSPEATARLAALRDALLPRLLSGELAVADLGNE